MFNGKGLLVLSYVILIGFSGFQMWHKSYIQNEIMYVKGDNEYWRYQCLDERYKREKAQNELEKIAERAELAETRLKQLVDAEIAHW